MHMDTGRRQRIRYRNFPSIASLSLSLSVYLSSSSESMINIEARKHDPSNFKIGKYKCSVRSTLLFILREIKEIWKKDRRIQMWLEYTRLSICIYFVVTLELNGSVSFSSSSLEICLSIRGTSLNIRIPCSRNLYNSVPLEKGDFSILFIYNS